ncbi:hypothetical protein KXQ82_12495 [Mucilaginibacter sp. HMF5004]|uniref:hypothetical protein n=1 Tax=Mucilaginibacter rivuli TaxID=2857527 RepID=UPI001C5F383A|nr:hypothetical protein [Mucilaginibacter rivuli]MBW4890547.1 hypothetical protein [Mucilaginibacter rivuli]
MNWKLIFQLSLFGLVMAFGTISLIPDKIEPLFWLAIFIVVGYIIAKTCTQKIFLHGFFVSMFNCVWIMIAHVLFYRSYAQHHPEMVNMFSTNPLHNHPRVLMLITGPFIGAFFGLFQGLFAFIISRFVKPNITK